MMKRLFLVLLTVAMMLSICSCNQKKQPAPSETGELDITAETEEYNPEFYQTDVETTNIETPYCTVSYPEEWAGKVDVTTTEEGENFRVIFTALYSEVNVPLYDIVFGSCESGFKLGDLPYDGGSIEVFCDDYTAEGADMVPTEFSEDYAVMCEDLNVIVSNLVYQNGMTVAVN